MKIRPIVSPSGKTRYQAQLWYDNEFYKSKIFEQEHLAKLWHETTLIKAIKGLILPARDQAKQREQEQAQREREAALALPLSHFAQRYTEKGLHGKNRNNEYILVAEHFGSKPLRAFSGKNGAALIAQATKDLYWMRQRGIGSLESDSQGDSAPAKPLTHSTVQKRLTALIRLIGFAASELPEGTEFTVPDMAAHKKYGGWTLPPAHANPRQRLASDHELAAVLHAADPQGDLGQLLQVQDETGCRLGELLHAGGAQVTAFFDASGQLFGGKLHLPTHKTYCKTGKARDVPLSLRAAAILLARKQVCGDGPLFPSLGSTDAVCKRFDSVCAQAGVKDLLTKDLRRGFVNRNKNCVPTLDLVQIVGKSDQLDLENPSLAEKSVQTALGHKKLQTTKGYSVLDLEALACTFTATSRNAAVLELVQRMPPRPPQDCNGRAKAQDCPALAGRIPLPRPSAEVLALARALGTYDQCFNFA